MSIFHLMDFNIQSETEYITKVYLHDINNVEDINITKTHRNLFCC